MEEVLAQLPDILAAGEAAGAAAEEGDFDAVLAQYEELHEVWEEVEGTIKATDLDIYEEIETAQSLIKDGGENEDAERVATGVADQADAVNSFIAGQQLSRWFTTPARAARGRRCLASRLVLGVSAARAARRIGGRGRRESWRRPPTAQPGELSASRRRSTSCTRCDCPSTARCACSTRASARQPSRRPAPGYLDCFESVEAPLDVVAGTDFRFEVEDIFARVRGLIDTGAPTAEIRDRIVQLRGPHRRERAPAHRQGRRRTGAGLRPVLHPAAARGPRGRAAPVGAPHLPRVERARPPQAPDPLRRRPGRRCHGGHLLRGRRRSSRCCRSAERCSRRSSGCRPWSCSSTCRSG